MKRMLTVAIYAISGVVGMAAFAYPLFLPQLPQPAGPAESAPWQAGNAPILTMVLLLLSLGALWMEAQGREMNARIVAALGVLVAGTAVLRFIETAVPGPGGFSPVFVPIILAGYVFGARFGFLLGTMSLLVSALITAGVGPWLPYQMLVAGWIGLSAGWLPHPANPRLELLMLAGFAFLWGVLFGAVMNLYFWPFLTGDYAGAWQPGGTLGQTLARYGVFYTATSLLWDLTRGLGNLVLMSALGLPVVRAFSRIRDRFRFQLA